MKISSSMDEKDAEAVKDIYPLNVIFQEIRELSTRISRIERFLALPTYERGKE